jgi:asparagine synthase (glutamine-hydrolysing)
MCGIAGYVLRDGVASAATVTRQLEVLRLRGPDAEGIFQQGRAAIGQTRLSIIDLATGDPPIVTADGTCGVAFNGEIYNYAALHSQAAARGAVFRTQGDTEVLAQLSWLDDDPVAITRQLDGMFAFAVWDTKRDRLLLGRDRFGKKPLYYWTDGRTFVFGSEIKALLRHPDVPRRVDHSVVPTYLRFGYVPSPRTFYDGIVSVPPGHVVIVDRELRVTTKEFWRPPLVGVDAEQLDLSPAEAARTTLHLLRAAVEKRMVADVPIGAFLSGGVDSSAVVALMAQAATGPVRTFTIGFDDTSGFDERPHARLVAERFGTEHTEFVVTPDAASLVERLVEAHDQPFGDSSAVPTYLLSELTRQHVTVALCGDGGDELFVGYERFAAGLGAAAWSRVPRAGRSAASRIAHLVPGGQRSQRIERLLDNAGHGLPEAFRRWIAFIPEADVRQLAPWDDGWGLADYQAIWDRSRGATTLNRLIDLTLRTYLLDDLLPKVDRTGMANSLEVRSPFLDHELVEMALRLPGRVRLRGFGLKRVLKDAVRGLVPDEVLDRPKHGFGVPLDRWFREDLQPMVDATIGSADGHVRTLLQPAPLDRILAEHASGQVNHGHALWTLLTLELFLRREAA